MNGSRRQEGGPTTTDRVDEPSSYVTSFRRHLRAANKSPKTIKSYEAAAVQLGVFLASRGLPTDPRGITGAQIEEFLGDLLARTSASTAATRYRGVQQFFKWLDHEGEIEASPMLKMRPPTVPEQPVPVLDDQALVALLRSCEGPAFEQRRDLALFRVMIDTGLRLAELGNLRYHPTDEDLTDVDLDANTVTVMGKDSRIRVVRIGAKAVQALDRYLRDRARHPHRHSEWLWLSQKGRLTDSGIYQVMRRRAQQAGIGPINPHKFRHTFAHLWLDSGGTEGDSCVWPAGAPASDRF